ncbi:MAG: response regulator transcription factor, partial [Antricoccus sp.]
AAGFLNKDAAAETIAAAISAAAEGRSLLDARAMAALLGQQTVAPAADAAGLTSREFDVIHLIAQGLSNQQIARELVLGMSTVKTHINHILAKTSCRDRAAVVSYAYENGLV